MTSDSLSHGTATEKKTPFPTLTQTLGRTLRELRRNRGLSLADVTEATALSPSFLSLVENGRSDISISRLMRVAHFYDISIAELLNEDGNRERDRVVVRANDTKRISSPGEGIDILLLTADTRRAMMPVLLQFEPEGGFEESAQHEGEELVFVLDGELELRLGDSVYVLNPGDCAYFSSQMPHAFRNTARGRTKTLGVLTPPVW